MGIFCKPYTQIAPLLVGLPVVADMLPSVMRQKMPRPSFVLAFSASSSAMRACKACMVTGDFTLTLVVLTAGFASGTTRPPLLAAVATLSVPRMFRLLIAFAPLLLVAAIHSLTDCSR